jgi:hypothetical protein
MAGCPCWHQVCQKSDVKVMCHTRASLHAPFVMYVHVCRDSSCMHTHVMCARLGACRLPCVLKRARDACMHTPCMHTHVMCARLGACRRPCVLKRARHVCIHTSCMHTHVMHAYTRHACIHTSCVHRAGGLQAAMCTKKGTWSSLPLLSPLRPCCPSCRWGG